jgi:hypothetical protein
MTAARSTTSSLQSLLDAQIVRGATLCFVQAARMTDRPAELERVRRLRAWLRMEKLRLANALVPRVLLERDLKGGIPLTLQEQFDQRSLDVLGSQLKSNCWSTLLTLALRGFQSNDFKRAIIQMVGSHARDHHSTDCI